MTQPVMITTATHGVVSAQLAFTMFCNPTTAKLPMSDQQKIFKQLCEYGLPEAFEAAQIVLKHPTVYGAKSVERARALKAKKPQGLVAIHDTNELLLLLSYAEAGDRLRLTFKVNAIARVGYLKLIVESGALRFPLLGDMANLIALVGSSSWGSDDNRRFIVVVPRTLETSERSRIANLLGGALEFIEFLS